MSLRAENYPPDNYRTPAFPSISFHLMDVTTDHRWSLYYIYDIWRFTVLWTLIIYAAVHLAAAIIALVMQGGKKRSLMYLWVAPIVYVAAALIQGLLAGSVVGLVYVNHVQSSTTGF
ncbi:hypothetical protein ACHAQA_001236 [Verticillium albo-atrum]